MDKILNDFSVRALAAAIEANLFAYFQFLGRSSFVEHYDNPNMTGILTGIPHPFMNGILRLKIPSDQAIEEALTYFNSQKVPFLWWMGSATQTSDWKTCLEAHGVVCDKHIPGMAVDLSALNEVHSSPPGLIIKPVGNMETLEQWVEGAIIGYELPTGCKARCIKLFASLGFDFPLRNFVGLMDGKPVAGSQLFIAEGVAGIYWVSTVPAARGQGIGTALTLAPLQEARTMGYRIGILQSSEMGLGVYRRLGFEAYCKIRFGYIPNGENQ
jgi:ribosomal protein S18 acetylase RimI-like enzyme